ncbi:MAG: serine/threonine protein kinase [Thermoguttaceae bacterium]
MTNASIKSSNSPPSNISEFHIPDKIKENVLSVANNPADFPSDLPEKIGDSQLPDSKLPDSQLPDSTDSLMMRASAQLPEIQNDTKSNEHQMQTSSSMQDLFTHIAATGSVSSNSAPSSHFPELELIQDATLEQPAIQPLTSEMFSRGNIPSGTVLGHFIIKSYIGGGGMGRVYLATDTALDRLVAIKILPRQRVGESATVARFMNEARSAARLNHEHIAQVYFTGEQDGIPFIVFEYVEGTNLRAMVEEYGPIPLPQSLNFLIQIVNALAHAAEHGVIHRDVKPSNILITKEGRAKLIDMGLARLLDPSESQHDLTASGVTLGTFDYISPEQARDPRSADTRSDIYSLGCTLFYMLAGQPPFPEGTVLQKLLQHQGDKPPDIRSFSPHVPADMAAIIQRMMAKDPAQRFQTPSILLDILVSIAKRIGLQQVTPGKMVWGMAPTSKRSTWIRHLPWIGSISMLCFLAVCLNFYWNRNSRFELPPLPQVKGVRPAEQKLPGTPTKEEAQWIPASFPAAINFSSPDLIHWNKALIPLTLNLENSNKQGRFSWNVAQTLNIHGAGRSLPWQRAGIETQNLYDIVAGRFAGSDNPERFHTMSVATSTDRGESLFQTVRFVDPIGTTPGCFPTLAAAVADAPDGTTIELKWNGMMDIVPLEITQKRIRIIAANGFEPLLVFDPAASMTASSTYRDQFAMFKLHGSDLEWSGVGIEMRIQKDILATRWTLFELTGQNRLVISRSLLTIRNKATHDNSAYHDDVAFFRTVPLYLEYSLHAFSPQEIKSPNVSMDALSHSNQSDVSITSTAYSQHVPMIPATSAMRFADDATRHSLPETNSSAIQIRIQDSLLRGEATGLRCEANTPTSWDLKNTFVALAKSLVQMDAISSAQMIPLIQIFCDHVSFFGRQVVAKLECSSGTSEMGKVEIDSRDSIFLLEHAPLISFSGMRSQEEAIQRLRLKGYSDFPTYFQNVSLAWVNQGSFTNGNSGGNDEMRLSEWKNRVCQKENELRIDQLVMNDVPKPTYRLLPDDLQIIRFAAGFSPPEQTPGAASIRFPAIWTRTE